MKSMILGLMVSLSSIANAKISCEGYTFQSKYQTGNVDVITYLDEAYPAQRVSEVSDDDLIDISSFSAVVPAGEVKLTLITKWLGASGHRERVDEYIVTGTMTTKFLTREMSCP